MHIQRLQRSIKGPNPIKSDQKGSPQRSPDKVAEMAGTSASKVQRARTIMDHGTDKIKEDLLNSKISMNQAYDKPRAL